MSNYCYYISPCCGEAAPEFETAREAVEDWVDNLHLDYGVPYEDVDAADPGPDVEPSERLRLVTDRLALPCAGHRDEGSGMGTLTAELHQEATT